MHQEFMNKKEFFSVCRANLREKNKKNIERQKCNLLFYGGCKRIEMCRLRLDDYGQLGLTE